MDETSSSRLLLTGLESSVRLRTSGFVLLLTGAIHHLDHRSERASIKRKVPVFPERFNGESKVALDHGQRYVDVARNAIPSPEPGLRAWLSSAGYSRIAMSF